MNQPADPAQERELIARARDGDEAAFAELVTEHAARVYGALRRFGLTPPEADEVSQEVFLRAWRGLARFEERSKFSTWLYRIAFNEAQRRLAQVDGQLQRLKEESERIHKEQARIRENLQALGDRSSEKELRERFVRTLTGQEDRLEQIAAEQGRRTTERDAERERLEALIAGLERTG